MKQYTKDGVIKTRNRIVIKTDEFQIINPTEEQLLEHGWVEYVTPEPTEEELLERAKRDRKRDIEHYDSSTAVNEFTIQGMAVWLDKATRAGLMLRFQAEQAMGQTDTTLWYNGMQFQLTLAQAVGMLYAIEVYASAGYDNTQRHLAMIDTLTSVEQVNDYDYREGYPEKLNF